MSITSDHGLSLAIPAEVVDAFTALYNYVAKAASTPGSHATPAAIAVQKLNELPAKLNQIVQSLTATA